jgi:hypothetical protein
LIIYYLIFCCPFLSYYNRRRRSCAKEKLKKKNPIAVNKIVKVGQIFPVTGTPEPVEGLAVLDVDVGIGVDVGVGDKDEVVVGVGVGVKVGEIVIVVKGPLVGEAGVAEAEAVKAKPVSVDNATLNVCETLSVELLTVTVF